MSDPMGIRIDKPVIACTLGECDSTIFPYFLYSGDFTTDLEETLNVLNAKCLLLLAMFHMPAI